MTHLPEGLPELPLQEKRGIEVKLNESRTHWIPELPVGGYTVEQMRAYGIACYRAGMERAAVLVEGHKFWEIIPELAADAGCADVAGAVMNSMMFSPIAAAIRSEIAQKQNPPPAEASGD